MLKLLLVVVLFAVVTYAAFRTMDRGTTGGPQRPLADPRGRRPAPRPVAPDDDEDFLRWLDRKRRQDPPA